VIAAQIRNRPGASIHLPFVVFFCSNQHSAFTISYTISRGEDSDAEVPDRPVDALARVCGAARGVASRA
jgi:hypothetical protein